MVGHDPHDISDSGRRLAAGQVEEAVFLGHLVDACLGVFADQAEPVQPADVRGECLRPGIQNAACLAGAADHTGENVQGAIPDIGHTGGHHHPVIEDAGAGAMFGGPVKPSKIDQVRRAAGRDDVGNEAEFAKAIARGVKKLLRGRPSVNGRVEHQAAKFQPRVVADDPCQRDRLFRCFNAGAFLPGVAFDKDTDRTFGGLPGFGIGGKRNRIVSADFQRYVPLKGRQPPGPCGADDVGGNQDILDPGLGHHFGLAELLAGDPDGARIELPPRKDG